MSDHFQYLASMGPLALAGAGMATLACPAPPRRPLLMPGLCAALLLGLGALTWRQATVYADAETLYRIILARNPGCWLAHNNLGNILFKRGETDEAALHYHAALEAKPGSYSEAHNNLGRVAFQKGKVDEAVAEYYQALAADPRSPEASYNLANVFLQQGEIEAAISHFRAALAFKPDYAQAHNNLGNALLRKGRMEDARRQYVSALESNPNYAEAHHNLAGIFLQTGHYREAIIHYQAALDIEPAFADAANTLAWILATCPEASLRNGPKAVQLAGRADELREHRDFVVLGTLAAAYAEAGRFSEAAGCARRAAELAGSAGNAALVKTLEAHLALYQENQPIRDGQARDGQ